MRAPELTYRYIYRIDTAGPTFEVLARVFNASGAATLVSINLTGVPKNKVLVLTNVTALSNPGATQAVTAITISMFTSAAAQVNVVQETFPVDADENQTLNWQGEIFIPGRGGTFPSVGMSSSYDAGVASNICGFALQGVIIPRGNIATF